MHGFKTVCVGLDCSKAWPSRGSVASVHIRPCKEGMAYEQVSPRERGRGLCECQSQESYAQVRPNERRRGLSAGQP